MLRSYAFTSVLQYDYSSSICSQSAGRVEPWRHNRRMKKLACLLLALGALSTATASAAPHPRPYHFTPVSWIVSTRNNIDVDDRYVTIIGHVTRRIGDDEYWFSDGTGSVRLDSENFDLPVGRRIAIGGRIDQAYLGFGHLEVDVLRWHYAPLRPAVVTRTTTVKTAPASTPPAAASTATTPPAPAAQPAATSSTNAATPLSPPQESH
jgi:uncharacterized protein YdeI (BOF family)